MSEYSDEVFAATPRCPHCGQHTQLKATGDRHVTPGRKFYVCQKPNEGGSCTNPGGFFQWAPTHGAPRPPQVQNVSFAPPSPRSAPCSSRDTAPPSKLAEERTVNQLRMEVGDLRKMMEALLSQMGELRKNFEILVRIDREAQKTADPVDFTYH
jgi:hypothetical protein